MMEELIEVTTPACIICHKSSNLWVGLESFVSWRHGKLIQDAFPDSSLDFREMLISGTHPACWDSMYPDED